jgi:Domain of unknown function (DUF4129)
MFPPPKCLRSDQGCFSSVWPMKYGLFAFTVLSICTVRVPAFGQRKPKIAAPQPLDLRSYNDRINKWVLNLTVLRDHSEKATAMRQQLQANWQVTVGSQQINVPTGWLKAGLDSIDKDPKGAAKTADLLIAHLKAMKQEAISMEGPSEHNDALARENLKEILASREFSSVHGPTWLDQMLQRFRQWLLHLASRFSLNAASHRGASTLVLWVICILGGGSLLIWMLKRLVQRAGPRRIRMSTPAGPMANSWEQMSHAAQAAAAAGNYRDAIRLAYWAAIRRLDDAGLWPVDHARTHREYLRLVGCEQPQREPLAVLTRQFELIWYAGRPFSASEFEAAMAQLEKLGCA